MSKEKPTSSSPQGPIFTSQFPVPSPMIVKGDQVNNWEFFRQQWTDYEVATGLEGQDNKVRMATLRSVMGKDCLQILLNLNLTVDERASVEASLKALESYFKPKRNVVYERYVFNTCNQIAGESIDAYTNRLRKHAATCEFGTLTDELIRDRLVLGIQEESTKLRLLKEDKLDLNKALNICRSSEIATSQLKAMSLDSKAQSKEEIRVIRDRKPKPQHMSRNVRQTQRASRDDTNSESNHRKKYKCYNCGGSERHKLQDCPAYGRECKACKKKNHFASVCLSKGSNDVKALRSEETDSGSDDSDEYAYKIEEVGSVKTKGKQLITKLSFRDTNSRSNTDLDCQLDTGATCNVISHRDLSIINQDVNPTLKQSNVKLRLFDGSVMNPLGEVTLKVNNEHCFKFQVVNGKHKPILSAETCQQLELLKINQHIHQVSETGTGNSLLTKETILKDYQDLFEGLGNIGHATITVDPNTTPVQHAPRRIAVTLHKEVKDKLAELEKKEIIVKETEPTEWISSMVVVAKPGKIRICLDPKDLNKAIKRPKYQMPTLDEMLPKLGKAKVFTTLDAKDGFYQIKLDDNSSKLTTFWTPFGRYRYLRMPFGISSAPEEFESTLHERLGDLEGVEVLRDDMLVVGYGDTLEEANKNHDGNLLRLLKRAREINLKFNIKKLNLRRKEVKFMGHVLTSNGLKPDPDKIKAVTEMPKPTNKQETLSLLGFVNYLAKFLPRLSEVALPLRELTSKNARFVWSSQHDKSFTEVKQLVSANPVLKYYDMDAEVTIQCDASEKGLGATLLQNGQPVAFASRTLTPVEQRYAQIEKECLAIVFACSKFSQYITRRELITVESDHKPLQSIFKKSLLAAPGRLQRMILRLQKYNINVIYKPGSQMYVADHLSRAYLADQGEPGDEFQVFALELEEINLLNNVKITSERLAQLQKATEQDPVMQSLKNTVLIGWPETRDQVPVPIQDYWNFREELTLYNGVLFKNQRIIIPQALRSEVVARLHSSHQGIEACLRKARDRVFWPAMHHDIKNAVTTCQICAEFQSNNASMPMQSHEIPDRPWSRLATDLFTLKSKDYIVLVDYYSDYIEVSPITDATSSAIIKFLKVQFSRHGIPDVLVSDNGPQYISNEFAQFAREWEFKHVSSSPYHPKSNGKAESAVKIAKNLFKKAMQDNRDPWLALLDYRNTPTQGMQTSPAQRLMSRRTKTLVPIATSLLYPEVAEGVAAKIELKRQKAKGYYDKQVKTLPDLEIGQEVRISPIQRGKPWQSGTCTEKLSDRSYVVESDGELLRRNREALKPALTPAEPNKDVPPEPAPTAEEPVLRRSQRVVRKPDRFQ